MLKVTLSEFFLPATRSFSSCHAKLSGHNKWSKIKQKKEANDVQRGAAFGKAARDITVAVRTGGSADASKNLQLAAVLKRARELNVPRENIEKAIAKALQSSQGGNSFTYEALVLDSVGLIIECLTDNNNRTIHNVRNVLNDYGGHATPVKFMFQRQGYITVGLSDGRAEARLEDVTEELISSAFDNGALDFDQTQDAEGGLSTIHFICEPSHMQTLARALQDRNQYWEIQATELRYFPLNSNPDVSDETKGSLRQLIAELEANEDVLQVTTSLSNFP